MLEGPPGFPPLFPALSKEEQKNALLYISHADPIEREARITRVNLQIEEAKDSEGTERPVIISDLTKDKGLVYHYDKADGKLEAISTRVEVEAKSSPAACQRIENVSEQSDQASSQSLRNIRSTGFNLGSFNKNLGAGTMSMQRKPRNRPPAWKRRLRKNVDNAAKINQPVDKEECVAEGSSKRKAEDPSMEGAKKQNQNQKSPVASVLKPLPIQ